ncbi:MAG: nickel pincer cofactor biosynthesis protein LarC [Thermomicrobiales bacterium]|nr:nickel pincer cofactor biosynthesis protein LarC [Thermomicrobiales bacterium]
MATLHFDPFSGASGDMVLGALIDAGLDLDFLRQQLALLPVGGYTIETEQIEQHAVNGTRLTVSVVEDQPARSWTEIQQIISTSALSPEVRATALAIFERLAVAESAVHNQPLATVHFHEVGAVDAIVDICGAAIGFHALAISAATSAPVRTGAGFVRAQHGLMPVPAPATAQLIATASIPMLPMPEGFETVQAELLTPTGAAILATLASFEPAPVRPGRIAHGFGRKALPWPNALRIWIGDETDRAATEPESVLLLETNIDDMNPQGYEIVFERLLAAGALDCWLTPIQMKKNRPATKLSVLAGMDLRSEIERIIFANTTTLGVRSAPFARTTLDRQEFLVSTRFGDIRLKLAIDNGRVIRARPEYDDCATLARRHEAPFPEVWDEAHRLGDSLIGRDAATLR